MNPFIASRSYVLWQYVNSDRTDTKVLTLHLCTLIRRRCVLLKRAADFALFLPSLKGFYFDSPVWRKRWFLRFVSLLKPLEQMWHLKGHEPEWTNWWDLRSPGVGKDLEHKPHLWGFSCNKRQKRTFLACHCLLIPKEPIGNLHRARQPNVRKSMRPEVSWYGTHRSYRRLQRRTHVPRYVFMEISADLWRL